MVPSRYTTVPQICCGYPPRTGGYPQRVSRMPVAYLQNTRRVRGGYPQHIWGYCSVSGGHRSASAGTPSVFEGHPSRWCSQIFFLCLLECISAVFPLILDASTGFGVSATFLEVLAAYLDGTLQIRCEHPPYTLQLPPRNVTGTLQTDCRSPHIRCGNHSNTLRIPPDKLRVPCRHVMRTLQKDYGCPPDTLRVIHQTRCEYPPDSL